MTQARYISPAALTSTISHRHTCEVRLSTDHSTDGGLWLGRQPVDGECPRCGKTELMAYPVNSEGGWFDVIKCQACLCSVKRERGPRLGAITLLADRL